MQDATRGTLRGRGRALFGGGSSRDGGRGLVALAVADFGGSGPNNGGQAVDPLCGPSRALGGAPRPNAARGGVMALRQTERAGIRVT